MAKLQTVNVIELIGGVITSITSFSDDKQGNEEAEQHFLSIIHETIYNSLNPETYNDDDFYLDEGFSEGDYDVTIIHS